MLAVLTFTKILFQSTCTSRKLDKKAFKPLGWDEPLPIEILAKWNRFVSELHLLSQISIECCFRPDSFSLTDCTFTLLVFSDASLSALGTVAYLRTTCGDRNHLSFVMAKEGIALISVLIIPRLELEAAVLSVRLAKSIKKELRIRISSTEYYSDSRIVLHQLQSSHLERPIFVKNRMNEILRHSTPEEWFFVQGEDNPADDCTRGLTPKDFKPDCRWLTGPPLSQIYASTTSSNLFQRYEDPECLQAYVVGQLSVSSPSQQCSQLIVSKLIADSRDDLAHLKRTVAHSLREDPQSNEAITAAEMKETLKVSLIVAAEEAFPREIKALRHGMRIPRDSTLSNVNPYIHPADNLLKVGGRLEHADLPEGTKHPISLASDHLLTALIIAEAHVDAYHCGVEHKLAIIRTKYYLPRGRRAVIRVIARCENCRASHSRRHPPIMANLPKERLQPYVRPF